MTPQSEMFVFLLIFLSLTSDVNVTLVEREDMPVDDIYNHKFTHTVFRGLSRKHELTLAQLNVFNLPTETLLNLSSVDFEEKSQYLREKIAEKVGAEDWKVRSIAMAIVDTLNVYFVENRLEFDVHIVGDVPDHYFDLVDAILGGIPQKSLPVEVKKSQSNVLPRRSSVFFVDPAQITNFLAMARFYRPTSSPLTKFLLYDENHVNFHALPQTLRELRLGIAQFTYVLQSLHILGFVRLLTPTWVENSCRLSPKEFNRFYFASQKWHEKPAAFDKFHDMNGCPIVIHTRFYRLGFDPDEDIRSGTRELLATLSKRHNFTPLFTLNARAHDLHAVPLLIFANAHTFMQPHANELLQLLLPPTDTYSSYEKLALPFDLLTWLLLLATFGITFATIVVVNRRSKDVQALLYGEGVTTPSYNVVGCFFGMSQTRLPSGNFARIILIFFIYFCLVMRTAYQGVFYEMMTADMRKPPPQTVQELIDLNYTLLLYDLFHPDLVLAKFEKRGTGFVKILAGKNYAQLMANVCDVVGGRLQRTAVHVNLESLNEVRKQCRRQPLVLDEKILEAAEAFSVNANHFLSSKIEPVLARFIEAGIFPEWPRRGKHWVHDDSKEPQVLTVEALSFGFVIILAACGVSSLVFGLELVVGCRNYDSRPKRGANFAKVHPVLAMESENLNVDCERLAEMFRIKKNEEFQIIER